MCVLGTKKLIIAHSFSFGETLYERPKNVEKWHLHRDVLGRPQYVDLGNFHEIDFWGNFSIFPEAKCIPDIAKPK